MNDSSWNSWSTIETAPKHRVGGINLLQDGVVYKGYEWFENAWCRVECDQVGPYVVHRLLSPTHWRY